MRNRLIVLTATVALLLVGAVPVSAAPGGVPGPPSGHHKSGDDVVTDDVETPDAGEKKGNAYGWRIKNEYGIPYGHLQQCIRDIAGEATAEGDEAVADDTKSDDGEGGVKKALEACPDSETHPEVYVLPQDVFGAAAFWMFVITEKILPILGL